MTKPTVSRAQRANSVIIGLILAGLGCGDDILQALRHAIGPSAQWLVVFTYLFLLVAAACIFACSLFTARASGSFRQGMWTGTVVGALPAVLICIFILVDPANKGNQAPSSGQALPGIVEALVILCVALVLGGIFGGLFGALISIPGALVGRAQAHEQHVGDSALAADLLAHEQAYDDIDETTWRALSPSAEITIDLSRGKSAIFLLTLLSFAGVTCLALVNSPAAPWYQRVALAAGVGLFGLASPLILAMLIWAHPLLRFDEGGVTYIENRVFHWRRRQARWEEIGGLVVDKVSGASRLFGRYELTLLVVHDRPRGIQFKNWELPASAWHSPRVATRVYKQQIDDNDIWLRGIG